jgi:calcium-activated chloride channel regulator 1
MVTQASPYLFEATGKRFYFKSVAILIPENWTTKPDYVRPKLETFKNVRASSSFKVHCLL